MQIRSRKPHILIVDDDSRILDLLKKFLLKNKFLVSCAKSISESEELLKYFIFDLIILDVMLPEVSGLELAKKLKSSGGRVPILMLTALFDIEERIKGYESGANDYITKPFEPRELLVRINNLLKIYYRHNEEKNLKYFGNCYYDLLTKKLFKDNQLINLSSTEQKLLEILIIRSGTIISREELSKMMGDLNTRSIDVQITRIRSRIEQNSKNPQFIKTIRNEGYVFYL